jgi:hypothetical protein
MSPAGVEHGQDSGARGVADVSRVDAARSADAPLPALLHSGSVAITHGDPSRLRAEEAVALQHAVGNRALSRGIADARVAPRPHAVTATAAPRLQREVRTGGGTRRVDEAKFKQGWFWWLSPRNVALAALFADPVKRVFDSESELLDYVDGKTDYIGDVHTQKGDTFWFRLPKDTLTVLGEEHQNPDGNVEDVIVALHTKRFKYEPFNELAATTALAVPFTGTQTRLADVNKQYPAASQADPAHFDPNLENIVIKALTGTAMLRNGFIAATRARREDAEWKARATINDYSFGERIALYVSMAIHIAADLAAATLPAPSASDTAFIKSARTLKAAYTRNQTVLDAFMAAKDTDDLIAVYELTSAGGFASLPALKDFTLAFHEYGSRYIEELGVEISDATLKSEGAKLAGNLNVKLDDLGAAREAIMWQKILTARGFLLIGMGDAHRMSLAPKLNAAGIPHAKVDEELRRQARDIARSWTP